MIRGGRGDGGGAGTGGGGRGAGVGWRWCWEVIWKRFYEQATLMGASPGDRRAHQTPVGASIAHSEQRPQPPCCSHALTGKK